LTTKQTIKQAKIFNEIFIERNSQDKKWGEQNHPMILANNHEHYRGMAIITKTINELANVANEKSWDNIIFEEMYEAFSEKDPKLQRAEMVQVAAVAVAIIENLDRRMKK
jgi:glutamate synthase domain-containing protein 1